MSPIEGSWWRIDHSPPADWDWAPYRSPRNRFDPLSGRFRVRYAANRPAVAARERFPGRLLTDPDGELWLVQLDSWPPGLHLNQQANLDALGVDGRVSTGRLDMGRRVDRDPLLDTCGRLSDAVYDWWGGRPPPLVFRARTMPGVGRSVAFDHHAEPRVVGARRLREATAVHAHLVLQAGFGVPRAWLTGDVG